MSQEPARYPTPLFNMSPTGLPGLYVVLSVVYGFVTLFVSKATSQLLLLVVIGLALLATAVSVVQSIRKHGS